MKTKYQITDISDWFLYKEKMNQNKLHKLCYYAYAWYLFLNNSSSSDLKICLFENDFEAWVHGPMSRSLYNKYPFTFGYGPEKLEPKNNISKLDDRTVEFLEELYDVFKNFTSNELEAITRMELPWKNARGNLDPWEPGTAVISDEDMYKQCALLSE